MATPGGAGTAGLISAAVLRALGPQDTLPNVALYPHHASGTEETRDRMALLTPVN